MLSKCTRTDSHRVLLLVTDTWVDHDLFTVTFVSDCKSSKALRARLHQTLGQRLGGYTLTVDASQQSALVCLHLHGCDIASTMRMLGTGFPTARFGRVARLTGNEAAGLPVWH